MAVSAGTRLGPYEILEPLGAGGMGEVYRARDPRLDREVAVKVLRSEVASDPDRLRRFEREAKTVAALNHPHILTVHDVGTDDDTPYVVTELLEGETLRQVLKTRSPTRQQVLTFAVQIARGLAAAHDKDIVHRDLKPENLFLTTDGRIKILDFGLAKLTVREADLRSAADPERPRRARRPAPASSSAPWPTCPPSRRGPSPWTPAPTSSPSGSCSTRCSPGGTPSSARRRPRR